MRSTHVIAFVLVSALPFPVLADWLPILPGPAERVVTTAHHAAVVRDGVVWILRDDGTAVGRVGKRERGPLPANRRAGQRQAEEILDFLGIADADRDTDWAYDMLDDERTLGQRRDERSPTPNPPDPQDEPVLLAAGEDDIWIAGHRALLRVGPRGDVLRESGRQLHGRALAASRHGLLVSRPDGLALLGQDGDEQRFLPLPSPATRIASSLSGRRWAWAVPGRVTWSGDHANAESFEPVSEVLDLTYCGETLVVLLADSLLAIPPAAAPEVRNRDIRARRVVCPVGESMPWLAIGRGLLVSLDEGRRWQAVETPPGLDILDAAATAHHIWLATRQGLYFSSEASADFTPSPMPATGSAGARRHRNKRAASWLAWLPKVSVQATAAFAPSDRRIETMAMATFPLDPRRLPITAVTLDDPAAPIPESVPRRPERVVDLHDPDSDCLSLARRKAVEMAMTEPERARSYVSRAGRAALLPELRVLVSRRYGRSESVDIVSSSTALSSPLGIDTVNDIRYEARATWDLAKLVFSSEELAAQNQALHMAELRRDIQSTMNRLYFERRRLVLDIAATDRVARQLRASEIDAELDALSAGAFGACASPGAR